MSSLCQMCVQYSKNALISLSLKKKLRRKENKEKMKKEKGKKNKGKKKRELKEKIPIRSFCQFRILKTLWSLCPETDKKKEDKQKKDKEGRKKKKQKENNDRTK